MEKIKISESVKIIKEMMHKDSLDFIDEHNKNSQLFTLSKKNFLKALDTLCDSWNKDIKSRNFVKHLIGAFLPVDEFNKVFSFSDEQLKQKQNKCALTGLWVCGIKDVADFGASMLIPRARFDVAQTDEEREEAKKIYQEELNKFPAAVRNKNICYLSDTSNKFISIDGMQALILFTQECILRDEKEVLFVINKKRIKRANNNLKRNKLTNNEINKVAKANTFGIIQNPEILEKLSAVKKELEENGQD